MDLTWLDRENPATGDVDGVLAVYEAARALEMSHWPSNTVSSFRAHLRFGWDGEPSEVAALHDGTGRVIGALEVSLPRRDNVHLGGVGVTVDPPLRRTGLGRSLFQTGIDRLVADGRDVLLSDCFEHSAAMGFLEAMGLKQAAADAERRLDMRELDVERLDREYAAAERHAEAYELVRLPGRVPEQLLDSVVTMTAAINDAPTDDLEVEDEVFTPERIRSFETAQLAHDRRLYRLVARDPVSGELVGHTQVAVEAERPWWGWQFDTTVVPAHRGHRLGLLLKIAMLRWLAVDEPQLRTLDTWNAVSNAHMVHINEVLGYRVVAHGVAWQRHL
ncbi:GNAT family N-acetyltransferase [soil metagenome]